MKRTFTLNATTAIFAGILATSAAAGSVDANKSADVTGKVGYAVQTDAAAGANVVANTENGASTDAMGNGKAHLNYGQIISSLRSGAAANVDLDVLAEDATIETVLLSELEGDDDLQALTNAIEAEADTMQALHDEIASNAMVAAELSAEGYGPEDVVAVEIASENQVILVVNDGA